MNPQQIKHYEHLISLAQAELQMATWCKNFERVEILTARISEYDEKIKEANK